MVKVCVTGCLHGELDRVYADIATAEEAGQFKTDLVLCCGDFQSVRNPGDLASMSVPPKYYAMGDFWRYYAEEVKATIPTIFIGGNHEASSYLHELPYGGWVAPNIWYLGYAGVVQFAGLRIAGISGIYKQHDYTMGHYERPPYSEGTKRSAYHIRNLEVFRLGQLRRRLDIVLSHDWPRGIYHYGDSGRLLQRKRHFREEIDSDSLGSPPGEQLFCRLRPRYWFAAHLHCKFAALVEHADDSSGRGGITRFLALDKCLPNRDYLQFLDIEPDPQPVDVSLLSTENGALDDNDDPIIVNLNNKSQSANDDENSNECATDDDGVLYLDPEWLCILKTTNHLMSTHQVPCILPGQSANERCDFSVSVSDMCPLLEPFGGQFAVPDNFERTAPVYKPDDDANDKSASFGCSRQSLAQQAAAATQASAITKNRQQVSNPQTELVCAMLDLVNPSASGWGSGAHQRDAASLLKLSSRLTDDDEEDEDEDEHEDNRVSTQQSELLQPSQAALRSADESTSYTPGRLPSPNGPEEYDPLESAADTGPTVTYPFTSGSLDKSNAACRSPFRATGHNPEELKLDDDDADDSNSAHEEKCDKGDHELPDRDQIHNSLAFSDLAKSGEGDVSPQEYSPTTTIPADEFFDSDLSDVDDQDLVKLPEDEEIS